MAIIDGLVSYWKFNESSGSAIDSVGTNNLTNYGTATFGTGILKNAASFDISASAQYFKVENANQTGLNFTGDFSMSLWTNFNSYPGSAQGYAYELMNKWQENENQRSYVFIYINLGGTQPSLRTSTDPDGQGGTNALYTVPFQVPLHEWTHLGVTFDASVHTMVFYANGTALGTDTGSFINTSIFNGTAPICVGGIWDGVHPNGYNFFDGQIDELGAWNRVVTSDEMVSLYNGGYALSHPFATSTNKLVTFDSISSGTISSGTLTYSHVVGTGSSKILFAGMRINSTGGSDDITSVTYNGVAMTRQVTESIAAEGWRVYIYSLASPAVGTHNVVISGGTSTTYIISDAVSYFGARQSSNMNAVGSISSDINVTSLSGTVVTTKNHCYLYGYGMNDSGNYQGISGAIVRGTGAATSFDSNGVRSPAGTHALTVGIGGGNLKGIVCVAAFEPCPTSSPFIFFT